MKVDVNAIKSLREMTGAGMMDCKKALEINDGDLDKAKDWLREKGITTVAKKEGRIAAEGLTFVKVCEGCKRAIILEVNCETDFVSKGDIFHALVEEVAEKILHSGVKTQEEAAALTQEMIVEATVKIGEKLSFRRFQLLDYTPEEGIGAYIHMGGKISVLIKLNKDDPEAAKGLAMHIAANNPLYISRELIPAEEIEHETAIQTEVTKNDPKLADKKPEMVANIIKGKVSKVLAESTLTEQEYLMVPGQKVGDFLKEKGLKILVMTRYLVGEGIAKKECDFASEVMGQI
ncbi:MAG: translation elongation factor Ts [Bacilli bacterium]|jgi:elongation factor Ts|nr:translation elongation factor Ts [Bacilli bacterium]